MQTLHNDILLYIATKLQQSISSSSFNISDISIEDIYNQISEPPNAEMGHYALPCFFISKKFKISPVLFAAEIANILSGDFIHSVAAAGPYINIKITNDFFGNSVVQQILNESFFSKEFVKKKERIMYEYSQPNTHKELHVGHMRGMSLGNAFVNLSKYAGFDVLSATYPGDVGTHVAKCLWYMKKYGEWPSESEDKGSWLGLLYSKANNLLEEEKETENGEKNKEELSFILKELEQKEGNYYNLWKETRLWSIDNMTKVYEWAQISFDRWYFESDVDSLSLNFSKKLYEKGKLTESKGCIGLDLSEVDLGFAMFIKSDGNGLYLTKDIYLAYEKFSEYELNKSYYIVDKRQAFHFQQVFRSLKVLEHPNADNCIHIQNGYVSLPDGAMSSRKGNIIPMQDLICSMHETIIEQYLYRHKDSWDDKDIDDTAAIIADGAIKYGMICIDPIKDIVFDMNEWLKLEGNTGPYLQYVYARINSLCEKQGWSNQENINWSLLNSKQEQALLLKLSYFNNVVVTAAIEHKASSICSYLYELGRLFNSFYSECSIANAETEELKLARLALSKAVGLCMKKGLSVIGIRSPEKM